MTRDPRPPPLPGLGGAPQASSAPAINAEVLLAGGLQAQESGRVAEAERLYRQALLAAPRDPRMSAHLAVLMLEQGRNEEGVALLDQTLALDPRQPGMLVNRGNALVALDRFDEALTSYNLAIAQQPPPARAEAFNNLGAYLQGLDRYAEAADCYAKALALDPKLAEAWGNQGIALICLERYEAALEALDKAVALKPDYSDAHTHRGMALQALNRPAEALQAYDKAVDLSPETAEIWNNRSLALQSLRRFEDAAASSVKARELGGSASDAWNNEGNALQGMGRFDEAMAAFDQAMQAKPGEATAWNNRGLTLDAMGRFDEALASYDRAIAGQPNYADAYFNKALTLIRVGRYEEGWKLYEWRWRRSRADKRHDFGAPPWLGETSLAGKTLQLWAEQGFGDTLQMLRFVPVLAALGVKVNLLAPPELGELARTVEGMGKVTTTMASITRFDAHTPTMSLPLALGVTIDSVPADIPYLAVPRAAAAKWAKTLGATRRPRVGLAWSGSAAHANDYNRSMTFDHVRPLLDGVDAEFHSLQKLYRPADKGRMDTDGRVRDHADALISFSDTAALIDGMDVVVTVDTSVAHLAGAMGKPLLLMLPFVSDYRYGLEPHSTPWYPAARLVRQKAQGDWAQVVTDTLEAVKTRL